MKKVVVPLAKGFEEIEATCIIDVLRRAKIDVIVSSISDSRHVVGSHKIQIVADCLFENIDFNKIDMIVLPGGMPGSLNLSLHSGLNNQIQTFFQEGKLLGAICAAPLVLGKLGILKGSKATCYPGFEAELTGAHYTGNNTEHDRKIVTGKGAGVAIQFALKIVEILQSKELANKLALNMHAQ